MRVGVVGWGVNENRNYYIFNVHRSNVAELGFELTDHGYAVQCTMECTMEFYDSIKSQQRIVKEYLVKIMG